MSSGACDGSEPSHAPEDIYLITSIKIDNGERFILVIILETNTWQIYTRRGTRTVINYSIWIMIIQFPKNVFWCMPEDIYLIASIKTDNGERFILVIILETNTWQIYTRRGSRTVINYSI